jgi:hypothetical protein
MEPLKSSTRTKLAILILILFVFYSQKILIDHVRHFLFPRIEKDFGTKYEERFVELKKWLPSHGIIGYVSDTGDAEHFYRTQYALAPLILVQSPKAGLVVANFSVPSALPNLLYGKHFKVIKDLKNGVALLDLETK